MNILTAHNYYQVSGGEEQVFQAESQLLEKQGHAVHRYTLHNDEINKEGSALALVGKTMWNREVYRELRSLIQRHNIQIAHFHNTFPLISPAAYYAAKAEGIPIVQTCHNYRLVCSNGLLLRDGKVCEACLTQPIPWSGIQYGCYRRSRAASAATVGMLTLHRALQTWSKAVTVYIALTDFARSKLIQGGIPAQKILVKPNFVDFDPGCGTGRGGYALYAGRLSHEKGIRTLLSAWDRLGSQIPLKIVGDGPLLNEVVEAAQRNPAIVALGRQPLEIVYDLLKDAAFLIFPSEWYEGLPRVLIESFAAGTPVIASNLGSMSQIVTPYRTGLHFQPGSVEDLIAQVQSAIANPALLRSMRQQCRVEFEAKYQAAANYEQLMDIYTIAQASLQDRTSQPHQSKPRIIQTSNAN